MKTRINFRKLMTTIPVFLAFNLVEIPKAHAFVEVVEVAFKAYSLYAEHQKTQGEFARFAELDSKIDEAVKTIINRLDIADINDARSVVDTDRRFVRQMIERPDSYIFNITDRALRNVTTVMKTSPDFETQKTALSLITLLGPYLFLAQSRNDFKGIEDSANLILSSLNDALNWTTDKCQAIGIFAYEVGLIINAVPTSIQIDPNCHPSPGGRDHPAVTCARQGVCRSITFGFLANYQQFRQHVAGSIPLMGGYNSIVAIKSAVEGIRDRARAQQHGLSMDAF